MLGTLLSLCLLPRFKGAVLAMQWVLCMHGFESRSKGTLRGPDR